MIILPLILLSKCCFAKYESSLVNKLHDHIIKRNPNNINNPTLLENLKKILGTYTNKMLPIKKYLQKYQPISYR